MEYGEKVEVEYGEDSPSNRTSKASYRREFLPNGDLAPLFSTLLGRIPRKEWAKQEVTLGWNAEKQPLCFDRWNVEKDFACKTWLTNCPLSRYSTSFLK